MTQLSLDLLLDPLLLLLQLEHRRADAFTVQVKIFPAAERLGGIRGRRLLLLPRVEESLNQVHPQVLFLLHVVPLQLFHLGK